MTWANGFWFLGGLLGGFGAAWLLFPMLRGAAAGGAGARVSRWGLVAGVGGLAVVVGLYLWLGRPDLIAAPPAAAVPPHAMGVTGTGAPGAGGSAAGSMDAAVAGLEERLASGKGTDEDWALLAKSYEFMGRAADAAAARAKHLPATRTAVPAAPTAAAAPQLDAAAQKLVEQANVARRALNFGTARDIYARLAARGSMTADTWADYADVAASANGGDLAGDPEKYIGKALAMDPQNPKALWLQGSLLHASGRYAQAVDTWQRLVAELDPASSDAKLINNNIAEDRRLAGAMPAAGGAPVGGKAAVSAPGTPGVIISGEVSLGDAVKSRAAAGLTLYIMAKAVDQPGPPVAVLRTTTSQWPFRFKLDDSLAVMPGRNLSGAGRVTVEARISRSGLATAAAGDLQGGSGTIDPKAGRPLRLVIDHVVN